jgi:hypothetical protein
MLSKNNQYDKPLSGACCRYLLHPQLAGEA